MGLAPGCVGGADDVVVGEAPRVMRNSSTSGARVLRTLSSSLRMTAIVLSCVGRSGAALTEVIEWSPPPMMAIFDFSVIPYDDTVDVD